jgi:hypothetical protein
MATSESALASAKQQESTATVDSTAKAEFVGQPYLQRLRSLENAFPAFKSFLDKIKNADVGRQLVEDFYKRHHDRTPGRCYCLHFEEDKVSRLEGYPNGFASPETLSQYLRDHPAKVSRERNQRRLFILEDMDPHYVDTLGEHLGVDPLVFSEQMNTWNFSESRSIPYRGLPSVSQPNQSFTLRYYEIRTLDDPKSVDELTFQMTFAVNRRKYERWRDIDLPTFDRWEDNRQAVIRRCASFWTSQEHMESERTNRGWDGAFSLPFLSPHELTVIALILVDPGMAAASIAPKGALILQTPTIYKDRASLWNAHTWENPDDVKAVPHISGAYHDGCPTLAPLLFSHISSGAQDQMEKFQTQRDLASPLDELVFYWTKVASNDLIKMTNKESSNAGYYLLKYIAQHWTNQLELINCTVAKGEYFSDDYQARIDDSLSGPQWKADLVKVNRIAKNINYMRRQMNYFWRAMVLNLERLGVQLGCENVDKGLSLALQGAQSDFLTINSRLQPLRERVEALTAIADNLANLRAAFKGINDGEFGLRLSLFASVVFPLTLVASILSMGDDFLPGKDKFWIFWVSSLPFVAVFAILLVYGKRPDKIVRDLKEVIKISHEQEVSPNVPKPREGLQKEEC